MFSDFRILAEETKHGIIYSVHEVFYIDDNPYDYIYLPLTLISLDEADLKAELRLTLEAWSKPILSLENFPEEFNKKTP